MDNDEFLKQLAQTYIYAAARLLGENSRSYVDLLGFDDGVRLAELLETAVISVEWGVLPEPVTDYDQ